MSDDGRVHIWSNGTSFMVWEEKNCDRCVKAPTDGEGGCCDLSDAISEAIWDDGTFAPEIAARLGYTDNPFFWCKEFQAEGTPEPKPAARVMAESGATMLPGMEAT